MSSTYSTVSSTQHSKKCTKCAHRSDYQNHGSFGAWFIHTTAQHARQCGICNDYVFANHGSWGAWANATATQQQRKCGSCDGYGLLSAIKFRYPSHYSSRPIWLPSAVCAPQRSRCSPSDNAGYRIPFSLSKSVRLSSERWERCCP